MSPMLFSLVFSVIDVYLLFNDDMFYYIYRIGFLTIPARDETGTSSQLNYNTRHGSGSIRQVICPSTQHGVL